MVELDEDDLRRIEDRRRRCLADDPEAVLDLTLQVIQMDIPVLVAEVRRLRAALAPDQDAAHLEYEQLTAENERLREALRATEAHLSLLRHRGGVRWGTPGIGREADYDAVIGAARRLLDDHAP